MSASTRLPIPAFSESCSLPTKVWWFDRAVEAVPSLARAAETLLIEVSSVVSRFDAEVADAKVAELETETIEPPSDMFSPATVIVLEPLELARAEIELLVPSMMLMPLNDAFDRVLVIWSRSELKSVAMALRDVESSDVSEAARAFSFIWVSRSVTESPADIATSTTDEPRFSESLTASSDETVARWLWAMA